MNQHILVGVAARNSLSSRSALETASLLLAQQGDSGHLIVLHVIPTLSDPTPRWGKPLGTLPTFPPTTSQRVQAQQAIHWARAFLFSRGLASDPLEFLVRAGDPAEELDHLARERQVNLLVLGRHPSPHLRLLHPMILGGTTRRLLRRDPPYGVLLGCPLHTSRVKDLVIWYEQELQHSLLQRPEVLQIFTSAVVARRFAPADQVIGQEEVEAAASALERLASKGALVCQVIQGELRCWND